MYNDVERLHCGLVISLCQRLGLQSLLMVNGLRVRKPIVVAEVTRLD